MWLRNRPEVLILVVALLVVYKTKLFSPGWAILVGIVVAAVLFVVSGLVRKN